MLFAQHVIYPKPNPAGHVPYAHRRASGYPEIHVKVERVIRKGVKNHIGRGRVEYQRLRLDHFLDQLLDLSSRGAISNPDTDLGAHQVIRKGPVDHVALQEKLLGTTIWRPSVERIWVLRGPIFCIYTMGAVDFHYVLCPDRTFQHQDQAGDKVVHHVLAAETDTDGQRTAEKGERGKREMNRPQCQHGEGGEHGVERKVCMAWAAPASSFRRPTATLPMAPAPRREAHKPTTNNSSPSIREPTVKGASSIVVISKFHTAMEEFHALIESGLADIAGKFCQVLVKTLDKTNVGRQQALGNSQVTLQAMHDLASFLQNEPGLQNPWETG